MHFHVAYRDFALVGAEKDNLDTFIQDAGLLKDWGERRACPTGITDKAGDKGEPMVARAFHGENDLLARARLDVS